MTKQITARIERLEQAREVQAGRFIMWTDSDDLRLRPNGSNCAACRTRSASICSTSRS